MFTILCNRANFRGNFADFLAFYQKNNDGFDKTTPSLESFFVLYQLFEARAKLLRHKAVAKVVRYWLPP